VLEFLEDPEAFPVRTLAEPAYGLVDEGTPGLVSVEGVCRQGPHGCVALALRRAQPCKDGSGAAEDSRHDVDLVPLLVRIGLVDGQRVDPQPAGRLGGFGVDLAQELP
jgi:hypothetical protein